MVHSLNVKFTGNAVSNLQKSREEWPSMSSSRNVVSMEEELVQQFVDGFCVKSTKQILLSRFSSYYSCEKLQCYHNVLLTGKLEIEIRMSLKCIQCQIQLQILCSYEFSLFQRPSSKPLPNTSNHSSNDVMF